MDRMLNYIFGSLSRSEDTIKRMNRRLGRQSTINGWLLGLYIGGIAYSSGVNIKCRMQEIKIKELEERLTALEQETTESEKG